MIELEMIRQFASLPRNVQRAASRLAADMSELLNPMVLSQ